MAACASGQREVGGLCSLSLHNTRPRWYFQKEINIAISGGSCVCVSQRVNAHLEKKTAENFPLLMRKFYRELLSDARTPHDVTAAIAGLAPTGLSVHAGGWGNPGLAATLALL